MNFNPTLKRFALRVRFVRAWVGLGIGLASGGALAAIWSLLDWLKIYYTEWSYLGWLVAVCGLIGLAIGALRGVSGKSLADSIDRRAGLKNRLSTASERAAEHSSFDEALRADASSHLVGVKPAVLYPIRLNRWHAGAMLFSLLAACLFMLGNAPWLMSKEAKANRAKMQEQAAAINRVVKPLEDEAKKGEANPEEKKLAEEMKKLAHELQKARIDPKEALQRQNELSKQAEKLASQRQDQVQQNMQTAESAFKQMQLEQMKKDEQNKSGGEKMDIDPMKATPQEMQQALDDMKNQMNGLQTQMNDQQLSPEQRMELQKQMSQMQKQMSDLDDLKKQIDDLERQLQNKGLSDADKKALMKKLAALKKKLAAGLKFTKEMQEAMDKMMHDPMMKEILDLAAKCQIVMDKSNSNQSQKEQELTKEQIDELQKKAEELAKKLLNDDKFLKEYLQAIIDMLKNGKLKMCNGMCMNPFSLPLQLPIPGAPSVDRYFANTGFINKGSGEKSRGTTFTTAIHGQSREVPGQEMYIEMRGPTGQGLKSTIPYQKVLPSYKAKADQAINRQEIPPEHQKRVKQYFQSLGQ